MTALSAVLPLATAVVYQTVAYAEYVWHSRDVRVLLWALVYVAACLVPALVIDLVRLIAALMERILPSGSNRASPSQAEDASQSDRMNGGRTGGWS